MENNTPRVIIYIRVSTKLQEKKFSLEGQRDDLTKYAEEQGWTIIDTIQDVDSGGKLKKDGLNALLDAVEEKLTDIVLVVDQDRLSRLDTVEWEYLKGVLKDNNVKIAEPGRIVDLANEDDEFFSDLKNLIAQREKKTVVRRMMRGKRRRMREGKGFGKAPIGYLFNKETKEYELDVEWSWVIPMIDKLYLEEQLGMKVIADRLNEVSRTPKGTLWNETLVHRRLVSKSFHGVMEKKFNNGEVITIDDMYPPLRTVETYNKITQEREKRGTQYKVTSRKKEYLNIFRRTSFTCGECGRKINLSQHGTAKKPLYYLKHGRRLRMKDESVCDVSINTIRVEGNVRKALKDVLTNAATAEKYFKFEKGKDEIKDFEKTLSSIETKLNKTHQKLERLLELYLDGSFDKITLISKQNTIKAELEAQEKEKIAVQSKLKLVQSQSWSYDLIYELFEVVENFETELEPFEQAKVFGQLFPNAVLYKNILVLITTVQGAPIELEISIDDDPYLWHKSKM